MNKMKKLIFLIIFAAGILFACPVPTPPPGTGEPEAPGGPVPTPARVSGVTIRKLEFTDRIRVTWAAFTEVESYKIYRYTGKDETACDQVFTGAGNVFEDTGAAPDTPYYYRVSAVAGGVESEKSVNFTEGIYSKLQTDNFEPNDDILQAQEIGTGTFKALIYSFHKGKAQDRDWYRFSPGTGIGTYTLKVTLPATSPLKDNLRVTIADSDPVEFSTACVIPVDVKGTLNLLIDFRISDPDCKSLDYYELEWSKAY